MATDNVVMADSEAVAKALKLWFDVMLAFTACDRSKHLKKVQSSDFGPLEKFLISQAHSLGIDESPLTTFVRIPRDQSLVEPARSVVEQIFVHSILRLGSGLTAGPAPSPDNHSKAETTGTKQNACRVIDGRNSDDAKQYFAIDGYSFQADFSSVHWNGVTYSFNTSQAIAIGELLCAYQRNGHTLHQKKIAIKLGSNPETFRLNKLFWKHPALGIKGSDEQPPLNGMIQKVGPGTYRLNGPKAVRDT
jgi:hypothetical protein